MPGCLTWHGEDGYFGHRCRKIAIAQAIRPRFLFGITCDMGCYQDRNVMA
jgi:hypothetical protein